MLGFVKRFHGYISLNGGTTGEKRIVETGKYSSAYFHNVEIPILKLQGVGMGEH